MTINFAEPCVTSLGFTDSCDLNMFFLGLDTQVDPGLELGAESVIEFAGRACYQSFHRPNPATANVHDYIRNIIAQGHESVLEHATMTYHIEGVSRAFTHELVRHRHFNYSQLSQRFVDESEARFIIPPALRGNDVAENLLKVQAKNALIAYSDLVDTLQSEGVPRKQAREAARAVLPNNIETKIVVTGNHRAWREFLNRRLDPAADAEMREVAKLIYDDLSELYPSMYEDIQHV